MDVASPRAEVLPEADAPSVVATLVWSSRLRLDSARASGSWILGSYTRRKNGSVTILAKSSQHVERELALYLAQSQAHTLALVSMDDLLMPMLREQTRSLHAAAERAVDLERALTSRDAYATLLQRMLGFARPLERILSAVDWRGSGLELAPRLKAPLLEHDLAALAIGREHIDTLSETKRLPVLDALHAAIGCLYVMEGATLGGRIVSALLVEHLGIDAEGGGRFYASYGHDVDRRWREFGAAAEACCDTPSRRAQALASARETFVCFEVWFRTRDDKSRLDE